MTTFYLKEVIRGMSKNTRTLENGQVINVGSIQPNRKLLSKAKDEFSLETDHAARQRVRKILSEGALQHDQTSAKQVVVCFEDQCVALHQKLKKVQDLYKQTAKEKKIQTYAIDDFLPDEILTKALDTISHEVQQLESYNEELRASLSRVDKDISTIYHEIEVTNLSASQGYVFAKNLQTLLRERRLIKNTLKQTTAIQEEVHTMKQIVDRCTKKIQKAY